MLPTVARVFGGPLTPWIKFMIAIMTRQVNYKYECSLLSVWLCHSKHDITAVLYKVFSYEWFLIAGFIWTVVFIGHELTQAVPWCFNNLAKCTLSSRWTFWHIRRCQKGCCHRRFKTWMRPRLQNGKGLRPTARVQTMITCQSTSSQSTPQWLFQKQNMSWWGRRWWTSNRPWTSSGAASKRNSNSWRRKISCWKVRSPGARVGVAQGQPIRIKQTTSHQKTTAICKQALVLVNCIRYCSCLAAVLIQGPSSACMCVHLSNRYVHIVTSAFEKLQKHHFKRLLRIS